MDIKNTEFVDVAFSYAQHKATELRHEFIMPEHLLCAFLTQRPFINALEDCFCNIQELADRIEAYLTKEIESIPEDVEYHLEISAQLFATTCLYNAQLLERRGTGCPPPYTGNAPITGFVGLSFSQRDFG